MNGWMQEDQMRHKSNALRERAPMSLQSNIHAHTRIRKKLAVILDKLTTESSPACPTNLELEMGPQDIQTQ
jgi:hypothetical protein